MAVIALGLVAAVGWGASDFFGGDSAGRGVSVFIVVAVSELFGTFTLIPVLAVRGLPRLDAASVAMAAAAGLAVTIELSLVYSALGRGDSFATAPVSALATAFAVTIGLVTGDPLSPAIAAGLFCAVLGSGITAWASPASAGSGGMTRTVATCLGASAAIAAMLTFLHAAGRFDPYWATAIEHASTAATAGLIALAVRARQPSGERASARAQSELDERPVLQRFGGARQLTVLAVIALAGAGGDLAYAAASGRGALSVVSAVSSLYPLTTITLGRFRQGIRARPSQLAGAVLALLGTGLLSSAVH